MDEERKPVTGEQSESCSGSSGFHARTECVSCFRVAAALGLGERATCPECGESLFRYAPATLPRVSTDPGPRDGLARLLRDVHAIALWETRASVRAVDLDPETRLRGTTAADVDDGSAIARERRRAESLTRGRLLAARLARIERESPREGAVIRYLVERVGSARITVVATAKQQLGTGLYEIVGKAFVTPEQVRAWERAGDVRLPSSTHGRRLLDSAAAAWVECPSGVPQELQPRS